MTQEGEEGENTQKIRKQGELYYSKASTFVHAHYGAIYTDWYIVVHSMHRVKPT